MTEAVQRIMLGIGVVIEEPIERNHPPIVRVTIQSNMTLSASVSGELGARIEKAVTETFMEPDTLIVPAGR